MANTNVRQINDKASVSSGNFHYHFGGKNGLLLEWAFNHECRQYKAAYRVSQEVAVLNKPELCVLQANLLDDCSGRDASMLLGLIESFVAKRPYSIVNRELEIVSF